jgi:hypothetical protein
MSIVLTDTRPLDPNERLQQWREKFDRLPVEQQGNRLHRFDFRPVREPADPDQWLYRSA